MKRRGYVIEEAADMENLRRAFVKARRGKAGKMEVQRYAAQLDANLLELRPQLLDGAVEVGDYHYFIVYDPKERLICAAPFGQRVLHHALMNVCHADFERYQTGDSYASRIGRGTYAALDQALANQCRYRYWLKLDVRKYFDSVCHQELKRQLGRMYKDERLLHIFAEIIDSYHTTEGRGLPIGNLTSQYFANHYLAYIDHYVREQLHVAAYVRYMDDMMLWADDRRALLETGHRVVEELDSRLGLATKVFQLSPTSVMATFLGYKIGNHGRRALSSRSARRYKQRLAQLYHEYDAGMIDDAGMHRRLLPLLAFVEKVPSMGVRRAAMAQIYKEERP